MDNNPSLIITSVATLKLCIRHKKVRVNIIPYDQTSPEITKQQTDDLARVLNSWKTVGLFNCQDPTAEKCNLTVVWKEPTDQRESEH